MNKPVLVEAPAAKPVTLVEAKAALDISYTAKDTLIQGLIDGVTSYLDAWDGVLGGRCLCEQTWREDFDEFSSCMRLALLPVLSVVVTYTDADGATQTVDADDYSILEDERGVYLEFASDYSAPTMSSDVERPLRVQYVAGYEVGGDVPLPANIKTGILLIVRMLFDNPSGAVLGASVESLPFGPRTMLMPSVRMRV